jgi:hypothetical protein
MSVYKFFKHFGSFLKRRKSIENSSLERVRLVYMIREIVSPKIFLKMPQNAFWGVVLLYGFSPELKSQDVAATIKSVGIKKGVKINGGLTFNNNLYFADGIGNRMKPYTYVVSGNVNIKAFGFNIPVTFTYSNQNFSYQYAQPFNIVGLSPYYKSVTLHAGYRNLSYSGYTLNGHNFLGGGVDWKPSFGFRFSAMAGRLLKAVEYDSAVPTAVPSYERWAISTKIGFQHKADEIYLIWLGARDQANSIKQPPLATGVSPQENMVWSLSFKKAVTKTLSLSFEGARSSWTKDVNAVQAQSKNEGLNVIFFNTRRLSTTYYGAYKASLSNDFKIFKAAINYERVEPEYKTLGAYYFNSDLENVNLSASTSLMKQKINLSGSFGVQRDDLNKTKLSKMKRYTGSLNLNWKVTKRLTTNFVYSNFSSYLNVQPIDKRYIQQTDYDRADTLNFVQITQTVSGNASYKLADNTKLSRNVSVNSSYNVSNNKQGKVNVGNNMLSAGANYNQTWKKSSINYTVGTTFNQTSFDKGVSKFIGATMSASMPLFKKKLRASLNVSFNNSYENGLLKARLLTASNTYSIKMGKHHSFNMGLRYSGRAKLGEATLTRYNVTFNEFFVNAGYAFNF